MEKINRDKIAEFILKLRKTNGLSQEQMAKIMHVSEKTVRNWEQGKTMPGMEDIVTLVNEFSVPLESVFKGEYDRETEVRKKLDKIDNDILSIDDRITKSEETISNISQSINTHQDSNGHVMWLELLLAHAISAIVYFTWYQTGRILPVYTFILSCLYIVSVVMIIITNRKNIKVLTVISIYSLISMVNMYVNCLIQKGRTVGIIYNTQLALINGPLYGMSYLNWNNMAKLRNWSVAVYARFMLLCVFFFLNKNDVLLKHVNQKKFFLFVVAGLTTLIIVANYRPAGDVSQVTVYNTRSQVFSAEEFTEAVNALKTSFKKNGHGCRLLKIEYVGDETNDSPACSSVVERYDLQEYIVFEITWEVSDRFFERDISGIDSGYRVWVGSYDGRNWSVIDGGRG